MKYRRRLLKLFTLSLLAVMLGSPPAAAQWFNELRSSGVVGERFDGYAVLRDADAPPQALGLVVKVNAVRQQAFAKRAAEQGVSIEQAGRDHALKNMLLWAPPGTWFLDEDGRWIKKLSRHTQVRTQPKPLSGRRR